MSSTHRKNIDKNNNFAGTSDFVNASDNNSTDIVILYNNPFYAAAVVAVFCCCLFSQELAHNSPEIILIFTM